MTEQDWYYMRVFEDTNCYEWQFILNGWLWGLERFVLEVIDIITKTQHLYTNCYHIQLKVIEMETLYELLKESEHDLEISFVDFKMEFRKSWIDTVLNIKCKNCGWFVNDLLPETLVGKGSK